MRKLWYVIAIGAVLGLPLSGPAAAQAGVPTEEEAAEAESPTIIVLVRHAEVQRDGSDDPSLSREGRQRADRLAVALGDVALDRVYTTDYARTLGTAAAVAERAGLEPRIYDPYRLETFARAIADRGGRMLVVGHSNTTPELVTALGGEPGPPIHEAEHDRLYILVIDDDGVETIRLRF